MAEIAETITENWIANAPDAEIRNASATVQYAPGTDLFRAVRGVWDVNIVQRVRNETFDITLPVRVTNPKDQPFRLGSPTRSLRPDYPVYLRIKYSAPDGPGAVFWLGGLSVNVSLHLN